MYSVLLVDDEQLDLDVLERFVPWDRHDMHIAGTAHNGYAALHILRKRPIDLLITDIRMPIMNGLELAKEARKLAPGIKIIFISGHEDFQYAKKAISMNASSYILKPVDDQELQNTLKFVQEQMRYERERSKKEAQVDESLPILQNEMMLQWLKGTIDSGKLGLLSDLCGLRWQAGETCVAVIEADDVAWKLAPFSEEQKAILLDQLMSLIGDFVQTNRLGSYCRSNDGRMVVLIALEETDPMAAMQSVVDYVRHHSNHTVTVGMGSAASGLHMAQASYRQAMDALAAKMFVGKCRVISLDRTSEHIAQSSSDMEHMIDELFMATANYELVRIHDSLERLFQLVYRLKDKLTVYNFAMYIVSKLDFFLRTLHTNMADLLNMELKHLNILYRFETVEDIKSWLRRRLFEVSEHMHMKKKNPNRKLIREIEEYVAAHLDTQLQLRDVAKRFGFSPNYLGFMFKEATGEPYSDFVIRTRMEKASALLQDPKLKIYEVASRVGYSNLTLFSRHFKQSFSLPPADYRKQGRK